MDTKSGLSEEDVLHLTALKEVFGGFAHEIAQPLNAIMIASQIVQLRLERSALSGEEKAFLTQRLSIIGSQVQRVTQVVETFRAFGRGDSPNVRETDIRKIFDRVYGLLMQQFSGRGIKVTVQHGDHLPPAPEHTHIAEGVLAQGLAFARDSIGLIAGKHAKDGISYDPHLEISVADCDGTATIGLVWNAGSLTSGLPVLDPQGHLGLVTAQQILASFGGNLEAGETSLTIAFPR